MKLLPYSKYDIKKEKDNTCNKSVDSVDKKIRKRGEWSGKEYSLSGIHDRVFVIC
jgi:hypothetical protein